MRLIFGAVLFVALAAVVVLPVDAAKEQRRLRIRRRIRKRIRGTAEQPNHKLSTTVTGNSDGEVTAVTVSVQHDQNLPTPVGGETECRGGGDGGCVTTYTLLPEAPIAGCDVDPAETIFSTDFDLSFTGDDVGTEGLVFRMTPKMRDSNGRKVGKSKKHQRITVEVMEPLVSKPWIVQLDKSNFMLRVEVGNADEVVRVDVKIINAEENPSKPESLSLTSGSSSQTSSSTASDALSKSETAKPPAASSSSAIFKSRTLTFKDPTSAAGQSYDVVVSLYSKDESSLGSSEYSVVVEGLEES